MGARFKSRSWSCKGESRGLGPGSGSGSSLHPSVSQGRAGGEGGVRRLGATQGPLPPLLHRLELRQQLLHVMAPPPSSTRTGRRNLAAWPKGPCCWSLAGGKVVQTVRVGVTGTAILHDKEACNRPVTFNHLSLPFHSQPLCFLPGAGRQAGRHEFRRRLVGWNALRCCVMVEPGQCEGV